MPVNTSEPTLPGQLFLRSIGYVDGKVSIVTMQTTTGKSYYFQPIEDKQYAVMYETEKSPLMSTANIPTCEAPSVLETIFRAGTLENILALQQSRQLVECVHRRK